MQDGIGQMGAGDSDMRIAGEDLQHHRQPRTATEIHEPVRVLKREFQGGGPMHEHHKEHDHGHMHHMSHHLEAEKKQHHHAHEHAKHHMERHHDRHHDSQHGHDHAKHEY